MQIIDHVPDGTLRFGQLLKEFLLSIFGKMTIYNKC